MSGFSFMTGAILLFTFHGFPFGWGRGKGRGVLFSINRDFPKFAVSGSPLA